MRLADTAELERVAVDPTATSDERVRAQRELDNRYAIQRRLSDQSHRQGAIHPVSSAHTRIPGGQ